MSRLFSKRQRLQILVRDHWTCCYCGQWLVGQIKLVQRKSDHGDTEGQPRDPKTGRMQAKPEGYNIKSGAKGTSRAYFLERIARDQPDLLNEIGPSKRFKSARAAAIEAGIITPFPSLQLKEPAPTAQKLLNKMGQDWCLRLLEELSELCL